VGSAREPGAHRKAAARAIGFHRSAGDAKRHGAAGDSAVSPPPPTAETPALSAPSATIAAPDGSSDAAASVAPSAVPSDSPRERRCSTPSPTGWTRVPARGRASRAFSSMAGAEFMGSYGRSGIRRAGTGRFAVRLAGRGMHFGNLYAIRKWRLGAPTLKFGQFVVSVQQLDDV